MSFVIKFNNQGNELSFISSERELKNALQSGFSYLAQEFADDYDTAVKAQDEISEMSAEALQEYSFTTNPRAYRSTLTYVDHREVSPEEFSSIFKHCEILGLYCR